MDTAKHQHTTLLPATITFTLARALGETCPSPRTLRTLRAALGLEG
jgi:hypothetical protein